MLKRGAPCAVIALSRPLAGCSAHAQLVTRVGTDRGRVHICECHCNCSEQFCGGTAAAAQQKRQGTSRPPGVAADGFAGKSVAGVGMAMAGLCPAAGVSNRMSCSSTATSCVQAHHHQTSSIRTARQTDDAVTS